MYCPYCGKEVKNDSKFCSSCGGKITKEEQTKDPELSKIKRFSIISLILSFIVPVVGLILSIIGITKCNKYNKGNDKKCLYLPFNIIGIFVSAFEIIIILIVAIVFIFLHQTFKGSDEILKSTWECNSTSIYNIGTSSSLTMEFDDSNFGMIPYISQFSGTITGEYNITSRKLENGIYEYELSLNPNSLSINDSGSSSLNSIFGNDYDIEISLYDDYAIFELFDDDIKFYCERNN